MPFFELDYKYTKLCTIHYLASTKKARINTCHQVITTNATLKNKNYNYHFNTACTASCITNILINGSSRNA